MPDDGSFHPPVTPERVFAGRVQLCLEHMWLGSIGRSLYRRNPEGGPWEKILSLPVPASRRLAAAFPYGRRLLRAEIHHVVPLPGDHLAVFFHKSVYFVSLDGRIHGVEPLRGGRPLCVIPHEEGVIYGEYVANPDRGPIGLFHVSLSGTRKLYEFDDIRHIHGVFRHADGTYLTTGDLDAESRICRFDLGAGEVTVLAEGSQQHRAVALEFDGEDIYFASDAPDQQNHFYRFSPQSGACTSLAAIEGPVFYMCRADGAICFGTVVEPSVVNTDRHTYLYRHDPTTATLTKLFRARKDWLPMKLFQYAQIKFPLVNTSKDILFTPYAVAGWSGTYRIPAQAARTAGQKARPQ